MEQNLNQTQINKKKKAKRSKMEAYVGNFLYMILGLVIIFSYVYQSNKQVYLNYEIVNKNKEINNLNIKLMEAKAENERLQTNETIEKVASEKLGMSYDKSDRVVIVKETEEMPAEKEVDDDKRKIKIFIKSLYDETYNQLKQLRLDNIIKYFRGK